MNLWDGDSVHVGDLEPWVRCPFQGLIPNDYEIRRGKGVLALYCKEHDLSTSCHWSENEDQLGGLFNSKVEPMIRALGEAVFEKEFPGKFAEFSKMRFRYEQLRFSVAKET